MSAAVATKAPSHIELYWSRVDQSGGPEACWPWTGTIELRNGYGTIAYRNSKVQAHKIALALAIGTDEHKQSARHACMNRACCNPKHLYWEFSIQRTRRHKKPANKSRAGHLDAECTNATIAKLLNVTEEEANLIVLCEHREMQDELRWALGYDWTTRIEVPFTQQEIGFVLGLTHQGIAVIERRVVKRFRRMAKHLRAFTNGGVTAVGKGDPHSSTIRFCGTSGAY